MPVSRCATLVLLTLGAGACNRGPTWDWREHYVVECTVSENRGEVYVRAPEDLPSGTVVEVPELPDLDDTINNSGIYMVTASLVPITAGRHTLNFNATSGEQTATSSCEIDRPVFPAKVSAVTLDTQAFARATLVFDFGAQGAAEPEQLKAVVSVDEQRRYRVGFTAWKPTAIDLGGEAVEATNRGRFTIPVAATLDAVTAWTVTNADGQSASYELTLRGADPWAEEDLDALRTGGEAGYAWAAEARAERAKGEAPSTLLINPDLEVIGYYGSFATLAEVERLAWLSVTGETTVETCQYASADGTEAEIDRVEIEAEIVVREARTGAELARKSFFGKPPRCPDAAEFSVWVTEGEVQGTASDQRIEGDVSGAAEAWFAKIRKR